MPTVTGVVNKVWNDKGKKNYAVSIGEERIRYSGFKPVPPELVEGNEVTIEFKVNGDFKNIVRVVPEVDEEQEAKADLIRKYDAYKEGSHDAIQVMVAVKAAAIEMNGSEEADVNFREALTRQYLSIIEKLCNE